MISKLEVDGQALSKSKFASNKGQQPNMIQNDFSICFLIPKKCPFDNLTRKRLQIELKDFSD